MRALLVLPLLLLTACGGSDSPTVSAPPASSATASEAPATGAPAGAVQVIAKDYSFSGLADLTPKAGDTLQLTLKNLGNRPHDLSIAGPDGARVGGVDTLDGGEQGSAAVVLKAAGVYQYLCTIGSHAELGMRGQFTVSP